MIKVTVVLHEIDGYQVQASQQSILHEGFAIQCGQSALQAYNAHEDVLVEFPIPASDAKVYDSEGTLIANVKR